MKEDSGTTTAATSGGNTTGDQRSVGAARSISLVILETPYAGQVEKNVAYARRCARDCAMRHEAILASHLLYTQFLDDTVPAERELGMRLGLAWRPYAHYSVFYTDRGWSRGMLAALHSALNEARPFKIRALDGDVVLPASLCEDVEASLRGATEARVTAQAESTPTPPS